MNKQPTVLRGQSAVGGADKKLDDARPDIGGRKDVYI